MSKILGIVAEYNPFHNGHLYHIQESKKQTGANVVVAVISGNFTQRGDTSIINKWEKAKMALKSGVDLVIELPTVYNLSSAENFAEGAIKILNSVGVDFVSFGTEAENINDIEKISELLCQEPKEYQEKLKLELGKGISYPLARQNAIINFFEKDNEVKIKEIVNGSNNILAIEYIKALKKLKSKIIPIGIQRKHTSYNSKDIIGQYVSATGIRQLLKEKRIDDISKVVPSSTFEILKENIENGSIITDLNEFSKEIFYKLRTMDIKEIANIPEVSEGLENLIKESAQKTNNLEELIRLIKSKRYTQTKIQRILMYAILGITKSDIEMSKNINPYIRVLGLNENGKKLLPKINANVITSVKKFENDNTNKNYEKMLEIDKRATDVYTLGYKGKSQANLDYTQGLLMLQ